MADPLQMHAGQVFPPATWNVPVKFCYTCAGTVFRPILDLGEQPIAERDVGGGRHPLALQECTACGLVQLTWEVDRSEVFPVDHPYTTGSTLAMVAHFAALAREVSGVLAPGGDLVIDIGANDGTFLRELRELRDTEVRLLGVEPTNQAEKLRRAGIPVRQEFWSFAGAREIARQHGRARVVTASNVLAHVASQHDFLSAVSEVLADDGVFVTENHDLASVINGMQIDTVYHEHLRYYSVASLGQALAMHGFLIDRVEKIPVHGGSFRTWAVKQQPGLQARVTAIREHLRELVSEANRHGRVYGIGATTRATPLIHWAGLREKLHAVAEVPGSEKIGHRIPGTQVPVVPEADMVADDRCSAAVLLAWHLEDWIVPALRKAGFTADIIVPLPEVRVLHA